MSLPILRLKKNEERRLRAGHVWIYSNEIDTKFSPLKDLLPGQEVKVVAYDKSLLGVAYVNPHSLITGRLIGRKLKDVLSLELLTKRLHDANSWREKAFGTAFYRMVFGESDLLPGLVVDRFDMHLVVQINTAGMEAKKDLIIEALRAVLPHTESILLRNDSPSRSTEGLAIYVEAAFGTPPDQIQLEENGVAFIAPLWEGQKTGWFYDHRLNRLRLKEYVQNRKVLDMFCYLGGWGIQAAQFGAREVVCVDSSALAIDVVAKNAALNQVDAKVKTRCEDVFIALKNLAEEQEKFDVIILDPPAFVKKIKDKKEGLIAYQRINEAALKLLEPGGFLFSCSCSMHVNYEDLVQVLRRASLNSKCDLQIIERGHQAQDHPIHLAIPETDYLKMIVVRKLAG